MLCLLPSHHNGHITIRHGARVAMQRVMDTSRDLDATNISFHPVGELEIEPRGRHTYKSFDFGPYPNEVVIPLHYLDVVYFVG
jgi:hypothetical protein